MATVLASTWQLHFQRVVENSSQVNEDMQREMLDQQLEAARATSLECLPNRIDDYP